MLHERERVRRDMLGKAWDAMPSTHHLILSNASPRSLVPRVPRETLPNNLGSSSTYKSNVVTRAAWNFLFFLSFIHFFVNNKKKKKYLHLELVVKEYLTDYY